MPYGAQYLYQGMSGAIPGAINTYDALTRDERERRAMEDEMRLAMQFDEARHQAGQFYGNEVMLPGSSMQRPGRPPVQGAGALTGPGARSTGMREQTPVPPHVAAKDKFQHRLLGAGGLGAPTYGQATPDAPMPGQQYKTGNLGPMPPGTASGTGDLQSMMKNYWKRQLQKQEEDLRKADINDVVPMYQKATEEMNELTAKANHIASALDAVQAGNTQMLASVYLPKTGLIGMRYDLNDPGQLNEAIMQVQAYAAETLAKEAEVKARQQQIDARRRQLGAPAISDPFELMQWMNRKAGGQTRSPGGAGKLGPAVPSRR